MTYAIIETGGKQLRVEPGRFYDIELLHVDAAATYIMDKVLLIHNEDAVIVGQPLIEGAIVEGTVLEHRRGRKVIVYKMQPKKKTRKKRGHRQEITRFLVNNIQLNGEVLAAAEEQTKPVLSEEVTFEEDVVTVAAE
ncbi:MAG: 50S ribosomal protein L21 [Gomphosphaeria aponina SAG 52.96 = DSM 107014]|uniref:Large ribosomal subunit protein bL21 n=1 Tax=Gomphosphaeria aponina SAG 52.96 = DSM 107014 TaxID=1521640 RepID=A0A941GTZ1_9CHRO|nr:50S ribosomal protein L21 [Gomphosphaeria aponina SAG 52.96 = DSM 107014]